MFTVRRCTRCEADVARAECRSDPDALFGPELLCPRCGAIVRLRLTAYGWIVTLVAAILLGLTVWQLQTG
jgi:hypothetical protein